ncbi:uncharacterized protein LOC115875217 [Sitophilus oryzae]|uniref:Uncharacterized protein LOC115875217 n=1 Tax=Sitophilus oryzae TaxID=7048 RepID=A0A6J2X638_SITOR|nr:uncharacterized protein LOC115875217 [Sitophilus oryzae]
MDKMIETHHYDAVFGVFKKQEPVIEQKTQELENKNAEYAEAVKSLQKAKQEVFDAEEIQSQIKWKLHEKFQLVNTDRAQLGFHVNNLNDKSVKTDRTTRIEKQIKFSEHILTKIKNEDLRMDSEMLKKLTDDFYEQIESCKADINDENREMDKLKAAMFQYREYKVPRQN